MSLVGFHRVLIACAILFCLFFGIRSAVSWTRGAGFPELVLAVVFLAGAGAFAWYLTHLDRFLSGGAGS